MSLEERIFAGGQELMVLRRELRRRKGVDSQERDFLLADKGRWSWREDLRRGTRAAGQEEGDWAGRQELIVVRRAPSPDKS